MYAPPFQRIVLTGFMGSGKTTVGRLLAARLGWDFADLDEEIARRTGLAVPEIFSRHGEPHFRREEAAALAESLGRSSLVLALGGGAPETTENRRILQSSPRTAVVYLEGPFETLQARCLAQAAEPKAVARPVLADLQAASRRFEKRVPAYLEIATLTVSTLDRSPDDVTEAVHASLLPIGLYQ